MTMIFAVALEDVAIVATETRVSTMRRGSNGQWRCEPLSDVEPVTYSIGETQLVTPARPRGIRPLRDGSGWCVASGQLPVGAFCLQELAASDPSDEADQVRAAQEPLDTYLHHRPSQVDPLPLVECLMARRESHTFLVHRLSLASGTHNRETVAYVIPPEFCLPDYSAGRLNGTHTERLEVFQRLRLAFENELLAAFGLGARIRTIAKFFYGVWLLCGEDGSVSDRVEVGIVDAKGDLRALPPTPCGTLLTSDDTTVEGLLESPLSVQSDRLPDDDDWAAWFRDGSVWISAPDARVVLRMVDGVLRRPLPGGLHHVSRVVEATP